MHRFQPRPSGLSWLIRRTLFGLLLAVVAASPAAAQSIPVGEDHRPEVPAPREVLGYELGERFTPHHVLHRYFERVAEASPRVSLDTVAYTFEGRELLMAVVTGEANHARLAEIQDAARRLADPRGLPAAERAELEATTPTIVWLGYTVHGNEASGTEASMAMLYRLAAATDAETRMVLDSVVVLIDPVQNPDGHERHVQDNLRERGAFGVSPLPAARVHQGNWPGARTSHYLFDLNRDWFIQSHPESRGRASVFRDWAPHVAVDLHEMGSNSTYFFAPPMEPVNKNVPENILEWWDIFGASNAAAFDEEGWSYFRREAFDEFYPGYGVSWPTLTGAVGMTYEQASSRGGAIRRSDGTVLTLEQAVRQHHTAAWATVRTAAARRAERVRDYVAFRSTAITEAERAELRAVVFEPDAQGRSAALAELLARNGIEVHRLRVAADARDATPYGETQARRVQLPAGAYVVDLAQPAGRLARAILEPNAELDSAFIAEELDARRTGQRNRLYDVTAWSLPLAYRLEAWTTRSIPGDLVPVDAWPSTLASPDLPAARYAYAFAAGGEAEIQLLAGLLAEGARVWHAPRAFRSGAADFPHGAFLIRVEPNGPELHETVRRLAAETGARVASIGSAMVDEGTDLGSNTVVPVRAPRVAVAGGPGVSAYSYGFAWFALDQRIRYPSVNVNLGTLPSVLGEFDVVVLPSASAGAIERELGESGKERLARWVREGGVLITIDGATGWLASERAGLARLGVKRFEREGAPVPVNIPGAMARAEADPLSPLLAGVRGAELPVPVSGSRVLEAPGDARPGEVVLRYASEERVRLSGYMWPEGPGRVAGAPFLWTERVGSGRVIAFDGDPNFRDLWRGLLPVFANAVFLGGSF